MSAIYISPIAAATFNSSKLKKLEKPSEILAKRSDFCGDFYRGKSVSWASKRKKENIIMNGCESIRFGTSNEGFEVFEQEAFVDGSLKVADGRLEATLNTLSKWLVSALFAAVVLWRHDPEALWGAMGAVLNGFLSVALKKILNQERPVSTLRSDPGMPSSHAQSIFYTVTFLSLSMVEWYGMSALTTTLSGFLFVLGSYFSWLRISQQLHTAIQVVVGAFIGSIISVFWLWSWKAFVLDYFVSSLWVRTVIIFCAVGLCVCSIRHVIRDWIVDERR